MDGLPSMASPCSDATATTAYGRVNAELSSRSRQYAGAQVVGLPAGKYTEVADIAVISPQPRVQLTKGVSSTSQKASTAEIRLIAGITPIIIVLCTCRHHPVLAPTSFRWRHHC